MTPLLARRAARALLLVGLAPAALLAQAKRGLDANDLMRLRAVGGVALSPDGQRVLYAVSGWEHPNARGDTALGDRHERRSHVWMVPYAGGTARQLTFGERGESQPSWSPDGATIGFVAARGTAAQGEEAPRPQLWLLPADGGEARQLTTLRDGVVAYSWSPDGTRLAVLRPDTLTREQEARIRRRDDAKVFEGDFRFNHLWVVEVATGKATKLTSGAFTVRGAPSWSPDGTKLAYDASPTPMIRDDRRNAYLADLATRQSEALTQSGDVESTPQFSPDGRTLAWTEIIGEWKPQKDGIASRTLKNAQLVTYDVATKGRTLHGQASFDVSAGQPRWSADGKHLWFVAEDRTYRSVYDYDVAAKAYKKLTSEALVGGVSTSKDGSRVALVIDRDDWPAEVYAMGGGAAALVRLTNTNPWLAERALGKSEVITWKSKDGKPVEGVLLYPVGYQPGAKVPLVVSAHGGPTGAHTNGFKGGTGPGQSWAARGWAVLYPNPRGSTGYGEAWMRANMGDWGGGDYRDIMTGVDELIKRGIADSTKMAFEGWSYGGYMTSWVVSQTGRFKAAMMGAGLTSLLSMTGTTDIPGYMGTFFNGQPEYDGSIVNKNTRFYMERSAISYTDRVTTPVLMLHGGNDERVPIGQPMEFYRALKDRGKVAELVFYPREGHGFQEYYHQMDRMKREYEFLAKYTLGQGATALQP
jgi:dipeptidyl aminopeptidase/acylaminoacyl peptidase